MFALLHGVAGEFSWTSWEIHPSVVAGCLLWAGGYLWAVGPVRRRYGWADRVSGWRVASFLSGTAILFVALNGPIHDLSDNYLFSAHMVQHLLFTLFSAPLWLLGTPPWLLRALLRNRSLRRAAKWLVSPLVAYFVYNVILLGWHLPPFYNAALVSHDLHIVQHLMFIAASVIVWWPVVNPLPELMEMPSGGRILYLFALGLPMSVASAFIALADHVLYPWYAAAPRVFELNAMDDQQLGGMIMWVPGMIVFWTAISIVFLRWARRENADEERARSRLAGQTARG